MINFCIEQNLNPVLLIPPTSKSLCKLLSKSYLKRALYDNVERANTKNVPILNYLGNEQFMDYSLYTNSDFLNKKGANQFTKKVLEDLRSLYYLSP